MIDYNGCGVLFWAQTGTIQSSFIINIDRFIYVHIK
jgi:hypothetical protein